MKRVLGITTVILLLAVYLAGYWPQHRQLVAAQQSLAQMQQQLAEAQSVARVCRLENDLLALLGQAENQNYGDARNLSNVFFDHVRAEADRDPQAAYKQDLESILGKRDAITAGLARTDASTLTPLRQILVQMHQMVEKLMSQANI